jgi:hypothetical protein
MGETIDFYTCKIEIEWRVLQKKKILIIDQIVVLPSLLAKRTNPSTRRFRRSPVEKKDNPFVGLT